MAESVGGLTVEEEGVEGVTKSVSDNINDRSLFSNHSNLPTHVFRPN